MATTLSIVKRDSCIQTETFWVQEAVEIERGRNSKFLAKRTEILQANQLRCHYWWEIEVSGLGWIPCPFVVSRKLDEAYRKWK